MIINELYKITAMRTGRSQILHKTKTFTALSRTNSILIRHRERSKCSRLLLGIFDLHSYCRSRVNGCRIYYIRQSAPSPASRTGHTKKSLANKTCHAKGLITC